MFLCNILSLFEFIFQLELEVLIHLCSIQCYSHRTSFNWTYSTSSSIIFSVFIKYFWIALLPLDFKTPYTISQPYILWSFAHYNLLDLSHIVFNYNLSFARRHCRLPCQGRVVHICSQCLPIYVCTQAYTSIWMVYMYVHVHVHLSDTPVVIKCSWQRHVNSCPWNNPK